MTCPRRCQKRYLLPLCCVAALLATRGTEAGLLLAAAPPAPSPSPSPRPGPRPWRPRRAPTLAWRATRPRRRSGQPRAPSRGRATTQCPRPGGTSSPPRPAPPCASPPRAPAGGRATRSRWRPCAPATRQRAAGGRRWCAPRCCPWVSCPPRPAGPPLLFRRRPPGAGAAAADADAARLADLVARVAAANATRLSPVVIFEDSLPLAGGDAAAAASAVAAGAGAGEALAKFHCTGAARGGPARRRRHRDPCQRAARVCELPPAPGLLSPADPVHAIIFQSAGARAFASCFCVRLAEIYHWALHCQPCMVCMIWDMHRKVDQLIPMLHSAAMLEPAGHISCSKDTAVAAFCRQLASARPPVHPPLATPPPPWLNAL
jgi:hypothetical protein